MVSLRKVLHLFLALLVAALPLAAADATALFKSKCAACHGQDGNANTTMGKKLSLRPLASPEVQKQSDADLLTILKKGKGKMQPYDGKIAENDLKALVAHVRTFAAK